MAKFDDDDQNDNEALVKQLGGDKPGVSTTMPVNDAPAVDTAAPAWDPSKATASTFQGFTPKHAMEGFDFNREQNTGKSAKDAFAYLSQQAPPPPLEDKAALGAWFKQYIEPGMNALGHKVTSSGGDSFGFENWQGKFDVDFGRGAGAPGGALAWQVQEPTAQLAQNATYKPMMQAALPATDTADDAQQQLQDEINAIINGEASPLDRDALLAQLQV